MAVDVCLVQMPYAAVERPSIALGTLHAVLADSEIRSRVLYENLAFAERLGLDTYTALVKTAAHTMIGEWTFAGAAFPDFTPDHEAFHRTNHAELAGLATNLLLRRAMPDDAMSAILWGVRRQANDFVEQAARRVVDCGARIVGCSSTFQQHCASLALLRRVKELAPGVVTVIGGGNCEGGMGQAAHRAFAWLDYVVSGEADGFFLELCRSLLRFGLEVPAAELPFGVFGPCHRHSEPFASPSVPRAVVQDLDTLPVPDYHDYFAALATTSFARYVDPGLLIESARGCWWGAKSHCTFCGLNGTGLTYRSKSAPRVVAELEQLAREYGSSRFEAVDNIVDTRYFETVFRAPELTTGRYNLFYETKANLARPQLRALAEAGVRWIQPGIESLHPEMVKLFRKGNTVWGSLQLLKWALEYGIRVEWLFLFGAPGERDEWYAEMARWLPAITHLQAPSGLGRVEFDRFSPYHNRPEEFGLHLSRYATYDFVYPLSGPRLDELAYFFEDYRDTHRGVPASSPGLGAWCDAAGRWRLAWLKADTRRTAEPPHLRRRLENGRLHVSDTRQGTAVEHELPAAAAWLLAACDQALPRERLIPTVQAQNPEADAGTLAGLTAELLARHLLLDVQGRLLDLTLPAVTPALPRRYPGGEVHVGRYLRDRVVLAQAASGGLVMALADTRTAEAAPAASFAGEHVLG